MTSNKIITSKVTGTAMVAGKQLILAVAVRTKDWMRPEDVALAQGPGLKESVEKSTTPLPEATAKITQR